MSSFQGGKLLFDLGKLAVWFYQEAKARGNIPKGKSATFLCSPPVDGKGVKAAG